MLGFLLLFFGIGLLDVVYGLQYKYSEFIIWQLIRVVGVSIGLVLAHHGFQNL